MTQMATRFVGPLSFEALCRHPVLLDVEGEGSQAMEHIEAARWADIMLIAPCTANMLGKLSAGLADDVISTMSMAFDGPQLLAPAMNPVMWSKPSLKRNLEILRGDGYILIEPAEGFMACGDTGVGRLPEEEVLVAALLKSLG
jgi:phosphopantothenoylcysteine decarboxylase/phosphopantothenate--cysteine ligase